MIYPEFRTDKGITKNINESFRTFIHSIDMNEYFDYVVDHKFCIRSSYAELNEYYSGNIPNDVIDRFKFDPYHDYILENLNTHNTDLFIRKMKETFDFLKIRHHDESKDCVGDNIRTIKIDVSYSSNGKEFILSFIESEQFNNFLKFFGYVLTVTEDKRIYITLTLEPVNSTCVNNLVYEKCHGVLYHVTDAHNKDSILESGIRIKDSDIDYGNGRKYGARNYFLALYPCCIGYKTDPRILNAINRYCIGADRYASVFKIDIGRMNISFYKDTYAKYDLDTDDAVYGYTNIPAKCITWLGDIEKPSFKSEKNENK